MRIPQLLLVSLLFSISTFAFSGGGLHTKKASEIFLPVGRQMQISLADIAVIKEKDFEKITGKHLNFFERLGFAAGQKKLRNSIKADGTLDSKKLQRIIEKDHSKGFHAGGFFLGMFGGLIGVLIAYLINDNANKRNRVKWAWIGFGVGLILAIILLILIIEAIGPISFDFI